MRKIILNAAIFAGILGSLACGGRQAASNENVITAPAETSSVNSEISQANISSLMEYLASDELRGRETGTEGIKLAADTISSIFEAYGIKPYYEDFKESFDFNNLDAYNIVGLVEGNDPALKDEFIIVGAHYDHIGEGKEVDGDIIANGANDNASGTVAVVELAKHFAQTESNGRSLLFVLFSAEEMGLQGSKALAKKMKEDNLNLYAMLNFEMIGVPMEDKDYLAYITGYQMSNLAEKFNEYSNEEVLGFLPQAGEYQLFRRSDNFPFYQEFGVPAQTVCTFDFTNYEYYHHVSDETQYMDYAHMKEVIEKMIPGITKMSNTAVQEIKMTEE
jgi:acetylornithine deacetylase/succinyl-diaminopimelate desuccinylase-like protein